MLMKDFLGEEFPAVETLATGIGGLDDLVGGGFGRGRLWVLTGDPASGKSTLLSQFVFALGVRHDQVVDYFGSRSDHPALIQARLRSLATGIPPTPGTMLVPPPHAADSHAHECLDALRTSRIRVFLGGGFIVEPLGDSAVPGRCLVIDDPEGKRPPVLAIEARRALRAAADRGDVVLVTVPPSLCFEPTLAERDDPQTAQNPAPRRLREEWSSVADVIVEIIPGSPGTSSLCIWQNRWGPQGAVSLAYEHHRSRFVELRAETSAGQASDVPSDDVQQP